MSVSVGDKAYEAYSNINLSREHSLLCLPVQDDKQAVFYALNNKNEYKEKFIKNALKYYNNFGLYSYYKAYSRVFITSVPKHGNMISFIGYVPKIILAQINTHRTLSKNAASSRAISKFKFIRNCLESPYLPFFTLDKKGMIGEPVKSDRIADFLEKHVDLMLVVIEKVLETSELHKQNINRYLEPFALVPVIISGTLGYPYSVHGGWSHFVRLRGADDAQPEIQAIAKIVNEAIELLFSTYIPSPSSYELGAAFYYSEDYNYLPNNVKNENSVHVCINFSNIHIPFLNVYNFDINRLYNAIIKSENDPSLIFIAQIARVSTISKNIDIDKDIELAHRLYQNKHMSVFEHIAIAREGNYYNYTNFMSLRYMIENQRYLI